MAINPRYYKGPLPAKEKVKVAAQTWKAGAFCRQTDTYWVKCKAEATQINGIFAENQASTATAGDEVWIHRITSPETMFVGTVSSGGADTKAPSTCVGGNWGLGIVDSFCAVSLSNDSDEILHIYDQLATKEPRFNDTTQVPGRVIFGITAAALTAEGAGL